MLVRRVITVKVVGRSDHDNCVLSSDFILHSELTGSISQMMTITKSHDATLANHVESEDKSCSL